MSEFKFTRPETFPPVIKYLIIANVAVYLAQISFGRAMDLTSLLALWPVNTPEFKAYQVVTHMFTHDPKSFTHIAFNMFALWMFGRTLENVWGAKRFLNFYLFSGIGAAAAHLAVQYFTGGYGAAMGASGAVMGVLVGFAYLFPNTELFILFIPFPIKAKWAVTGYVLIDLFSGIANFSGDNVAHFAHLGGALTGFILAALGNKTNNRRFY